MKNLLTTAFVIITLSGIAQDSKHNIYKPKANASNDLKTAVEKASRENKHVLVQVGGNWCPWCIKLHKFIESHHRVDSIIDADYVFLRVNYSKENKNLDVLERLEFPQRFGFPVMVVLNSNGRRIHTQETGSLEENKGYSEKRIKQFLLSWNQKALDPKQYK